MRRLAQLGIGALLLAVSAACGQDEEIGFGGQPPPAIEDLPTATVPAEQPGPDPAYPEPPAGGATVDEAKVDAAALPEGYPRVVWTEGDGTVLGAYGQAGGCIEASAAVTEQSAEKVLLVITETMTSDGPCTMELLFPPLTAKLDAPLADRTVVLQRQQVGPR